MEDKDKMENFDANESGVKEVIQRAILEPDFKKALMESPDEILDEYKVTGISRIMIKSLSEEDYEKLTPENINEYFMAESAVYTPDIEDEDTIEYFDDEDI